MRNLCIVSNCNEIRVGKGYCMRHYKQIMKSGNILDVKRNREEKNKIIQINNLICEMEIYDNINNFRCKILIRN